MVQPRRTTAKPAASLTRKRSADALPRVLVVEARYYDDIADELLAGATQALDAAGVEFDVVTVPGALEIPAAMAIAIDGARKRRRPYAAAVALGCVIRGDTGHYDIVAGESARALMDLAVDRAFPIGNGILTVNTDAQARARASRGDMNKGGGAAQAALAVMHVAQRFAGKG